MQHSLDCTALHLSGVVNFTYIENERAFARPSGKQNVQYMKLLFIVNGIQFIEINGIDHTARGGDIVILQKGTAVSVPNDIQYQAAVYELDFSSEPKPLQMEDAYFSLLSQALSAMASGIYSTGLEIATICEKIFTDFASGDALRHLAGYGALLSLLCALPSSMHLQQEHTYSPIINRVISYINDNLLSLCDLQEIADAMGISLAYCKVQFRREVGVTPLYYITWRKIASAKRRIAQGYSITDTAMYLGFSSSSYFSTVFRNYTSRTPIQYKHFVEQELLNQQHKTKADDSPYENPYKKKKKETTV